MLREAQVRCDAAGVEVDLKLGDWRRLSTVLDPGSFDAVLCTGNSIAHLGEEDMLRTLAEFAALLAPGGLLIVDTHQWELVLASGDRILKDPEKIERDGLVCERTYRWAVGESSPGQRCHLEFRLEVGSADGSEVRSHAVAFETYTVPQFLERFRRAGLRVVHCDAEVDSDRYTVVAQRP